MIEETTVDETPSDAQKGGLTSKDFQFSKWDKPITNKISLK